MLAGDLPRVESVLGQLKKHPDTRHLPVVADRRPDRPDRRAARRRRGVPRRAGRRRRRSSARSRGSSDWPSTPDAADRADRRRRRARRARSPTLLAGAEQIELQRIDPRAMRSPRFARSRSTSASCWSDAVARQALALLREVATDEALRERPMIAYRTRDAAEGRPCAARRARRSQRSISVADSPERLVDRAALFLHRVEATAADADAQDARPRCARATRRSRARRCS